MKYILIFMLNGVPAAPQQIGPFENVFACEQAAEQLKVMHVKIRTACVNLDAKPHHWNGKKIK